MTTTKTRTIRDVLNSSNPNDIADALRKLKYGNILEPIKVTLAALTAVAGVDITGADARAKATIAGGLVLTSAERLPAIKQVVSLRVTASGTAASVGTYGISDAAGTPLLPPGGASLAMGIATLSDDGKTLTFPNTVTGLVLVYIPRAAVDIDSIFAPST